MIEVRGARPADDAAWDSFVGAHPEATPFHSLGWRGVVQALGHHPLYLVATRDGALAGVLPLGHVQFLLSSRLVSAPAASYGGILADSPEAESALAQRAIQLGRASGVTHVELRSLRGSPMEGWQTVTPCVRVVVPARDAKLSHTVRRDLERTAGVEVVRNPALVDFYGPYLAAMERLGTPAFGIDTFQAIVDHCGASAEVLVGRIDGRPVASEIWLRGGRTLYSLYGGSTPEGRSTRAGYALKAAQMASPEIDRLDFGRSFNNSPSLAFKRGWGGEIEPVYFHIASIDGKPHLPSDPDSAKFRFLRSTWRLLPSAVTRRFGPRIVRGFH